MEDAISVDGGGCQRHARPAAQGGFAPVLAGRLLRVLAVCLFNSSRFNRSRLDVLFRGGGAFGDRRCQRSKDLYKQLTYQPLFPCRPWAVHHPAVRHRRHPRCSGQLPPCFARNGSLQRLAAKRRRHRRAQGGGSRNNDWDASLELLRRRGVCVPERDAPIDIFSDFYFGDLQGDPAQWRGFIGDEPPLVEPSCSRTSAPPAFAGAS